MNPETVDVAIIGAGVSGLTAAMRLQEAGRSVVVFEARPTTGGRTRSLPVAGGRIDLGATWVWDSESSIHRLLGELGIATFPHHRTGLDLLERATGLQRGTMPRSWSPERRIVGGTQSITDALATRVDRIVPSQPVLGIEEVPDGLGVVLADRTVVARHVLAALPPAVLATTIALPSSVPEPIIAMLRRSAVWMVDVAKVVAVYAKPFWKADGLSGRAASLVGPMSEIHDMSGLDHTPAALFGFLHRSQATGDWRGRARTQLTRLFGPRASEPLALHIRAWWEEMPLPPGAGVDQSLLGSPRLQQPLLSGRLHLISTETSAISPGHIDGAVERAEAVAQAIL